MNRYDATQLVIDDEDTTDLQILDANGNPTGIIFKLRSSDSPAAVALVDQFTNKRLSRMQRRAGVQQPLTAQELRAESIDALVACVKGWNEFKWAFADGKIEDPLVHNADNCRDVLTRSVVIRDQVESAVKDRAGFTKT